MSTTIAPLTPQGDVIALGVPDTQDYPRLVFSAPNFVPVPIADIIEPSVLEAVEGMLPGLVPPFVQDAANTAVQNLAVLLSGSTMSGPLFLNGLPTQPTQAADKQYVDMLVATSGVPEVPAVPTGQTWARQTGQWVPIAAAEGSFLSLSGGTMLGAINMGGYPVNNLPAVPNLPNGAAPAQWVLNQIAASSLYQGTWDVDTYQPDLTQPQYHQNNFSWIAITTSTTGVVVSPPIPGLQGMTIYNGDTIIYSANAGGVFQAIHAGGLSLSEADARYLQLAGGSMGGPLLLFEDPVSNMEAATRQWVLAQIGSGGVGEAPTDGQIYGRNGNARDWMPVVGLGGATLSGPLFLAANAAQAMQPVPLQQLQSSLGSYVPLIGNVTVTGPITMAGVSANLTLNSNASANLQAVPLQQLTSTLGSYLTATAAANTYVPLTGNVNIANPIGIGIVPVAGQANGALYSSFTVCPPGGGPSFNRVPLTSGGAQYLENGYAATISIDGSGNLVFNSYANGTAGATVPTGVTASFYLTQGNVLTTQGLTANGTFTVAGAMQAVPSGNVSITHGLGIGANASIGTTLSVGGACYFEYNQSTTFYAYDNGAGLRMINWQGGYADEWQATNGSRLWLQNNANAMALDYVGNLSTAGAMTPNCDATTKKDIAELSYGLNELRLLTPKSFAYLASPDVTRLGFVSQEVAPVVPEATSLNMDMGEMLDEATNKRAGLLCLDTMGLLAVAVNSIKELAALTDALTARVAALDGGAA